MKALGLRIFAATLVLGMAPFAHAQSPTIRPAGVRAVVANVTDTRSTGGALPQCAIELKFTGDAAAYATHVVRVPVKKAEDELRRNLLLQAAANPPAFLVPRKEGQLSASIYLLNPSRNASFIRNLEGEVELFCPTLENGGIIVITNFFKQPTAPLPNPALKQLGIEVIYLTKATYQSRKQELSKYEGIFNNEWAGPYSKAVARIYVSDTNRLVTTKEIQKADGTIVPTSGRDSRIIDLQELPVDGDKLRITAWDPLESTCRHASLSIL